MTLGASVATARGKALTGNTTDRTGITRLSVAGLLALTTPARLHLACHDSIEAIRLRLSSLLISIFRGRLFCTRDFLRAYLFRLEKAVISQQIEVRALRMEGI